MRTAEQGKRAAERLAKRWLRAAGAPMHRVGFSSDPAFYVIINCLVRGQVYNFPVPCWGARALRNVVDRVIEKLRQPA